MWYHRHGFVVFIFLHVKCLCVIIPTASTKLKCVCVCVCAGGGGTYWFHLVRLSVCGQNRISSVSCTILVSSISHLYILSTNFRKCVTFSNVGKIPKFQFCGHFLLNCSFLFVLCPCDMNVKVICWSEYLLHQRLIFHDDTSRWFT